MKSRPMGVLIFAILSLLGGALTIGLMFAVPRGMDEEGARIFAQLGISTGYVIGFFGLMGATSIGAGVGMIRGAKWGWWLATFVLSFAVMRAASSFLNLSTVAEQFDAPPDLVSEQYIKFGGRVITNSLVLWYFFSNRVMSYFEIDSGPKWKNLAILVGVNLFIGIVWSVAAAIAGVGI